MSLPLQEKDFQTDWAFSDDFTTHIHITEAKSGLNGYYCLGCKKQMQAVKGQIRTHYFRHHAKDVDRNNDECVVANRTYRERIAKDILHRLKELKVPAVYKYPPKNSEGSPNKIAESTVIKAHKVKSELTFYEDDNCVIQFGQNPNVNARYLLIRPDITFFNNKNEPILLVEFVLTHKINNEKRVKLKRLGLNTVQIIVPKKSESDIEKALKSRTKVKWIYNEIEARAKYVFIPQSDNSGVRSLDDDQQRVFEESYKCRASQIKYLIRAVKRALESQSYKRAEQHFDEEISRVEKATEKVKQELRELEERYGQEVFSEFAGEFEAFELQEKEFEREETQFQKYFKGLEKRYLTNRRKIEDEQDKINSLAEEELDDNSTEEQINREFREQDTQLQQEFTERRGELRRDIEEYTGELEKIEKRRNAIPKELRQLRTQERNQFAKAKERFDVEERNLEEAVRSELDRDVKRNPTKFSERVSYLFKAQRMGRDFQDAKRQEAIYKRARELFNKGTWEKR